MTRLLRPAMAGIALLLTCGILGSANPAFADKSAKFAVTDDKSASITVTDDKSASLTVTDDKSASLTVTDDKSASVTLSPADKSA